MNKKVAKYFPYKKENGDPDFRTGQKGACEFALETFEKGKRALVIDAPVGSGKSVINYTIAKAMEKKAVYITAQKSLQDQIGSEKWENVKVVKGKSAYACNYLYDVDNRFRCNANLNPDKYTTCHEKSKFQYAQRADSYAAVLASIKKIHKKHEGDEVVMNLRTGFADLKDIPKLMRFFEETDEKVDARVNFLKRCACNMRPVECPVKAARMMAKIADIAVTNPDNYYHLNKYTGFFDDRPTMIVDEAHRLEDAMQRIFKLDIPTILIKECFGIDFNTPASEDKLDDFVQEIRMKLKHEVFPIMAFANLVIHIEEIFKVHDIQSFNDHFKSDMFASENDLQMAFGEGVSKMKVDTGFCPMNIIVAAVNDTPLTDPAYKCFDRLYDLIRLTFVEDCKKFKCAESYDLDATFLPAITRYVRLVNNDVKNDFHSFGTRHKNAQHGQYYRVMRKFVYGLEAFKKVFDELLKVMDDLVRAKYGKHWVFQKNLEMKPVSEAYKGTQYYKLFKNVQHIMPLEEAVLEFIPLRIGCLLQSFFFSKDFVKHIVFSSGTWPDAPGTMRDYGFRTSEYNIFKVPTTFKRENRPIYVSSNPDGIDFSEKVPGLGYKYKTEEGIVEFNKQLHNLIGNIRKKHGDDCNIAIHNFTYSLSKIIAENYPGINDSFLIHLPKAEEMVIGKNGHMTMYRDKEALVHEFCSNPKSGLTLISPSVSEGLDFKGDICRAQIILKTPIPYLGDKYIKYKFNGCPEIGLYADPLYLDRRCAIDLNQMYGRNCRGVDDWGETYIFDLSLTKRIAKAYGVSIPGIDARIPGNMGRLSMKYMQEAVQCSKDSYNRLIFKWPYKR